MNQQQNKGCIPSLRLGFVFALIFALSCTNHQEPFKSKTDTVDVIYRSTTGIQGTRGIYTTVMGKKFADSASMTAIPSVDTSWSLLIPNYKDTLKNAKGQSIYDSVTHQFKFNNAWYKLTDQENKTVKIQIIKI